MGVFVINEAPSKRTRLGGVSVRKEHVRVPNQVNELAWDELLLRRADAREKVAVLRDGRAENYIVIIECAARQHDAAPAAPRRQRAERQRRAAPDSRAGRDQLA